MTAKYNDYFSLDKFGSQVYLILPAFLCCSFLPMIVLLGLFEWVSRTSSHNITSPQQPSKWHACVIPSKFWNASIQNDAVADCYIPFSDLPSSFNLERDSVRFFCKLSSAPCCGRDHLCKECQIRCHIKSLKHLLVTSCNPLSDHWLLVLETHGMITSATPKTKLAKLG